tara:strand:+ start:1019 stop:1177 length:159 start_codon:yes stop_codon:yes gene_type:complete
MAEKKETKKKSINKIKKFKITKANGKVIYRDSLDQGRIKRHEAIGNKVEGME